MINHFNPTKSRSKTRFILRYLHTNFERSNTIQFQ